MSDWCTRCKEYMLYPNSHTCPPAWEVWRYDEGETRADARTVYARDEEKAAERWADTYDSYGDYTICSDKETPLVCVIAQSADDDAEPRYLRVHGETVPSYRAESFNSDLIDQHRQWNRQHPKGTAVRVKYTKWDYNTKPPTKSEEVIETVTTSEARITDSDMVEVRLKDFPYLTYVENVQAIETK